jgi:hypothetical protein
MRGSRRTGWKTLAAGAAVAVLLPAAAFGIVLRAGDLVVHADGGFVPQALPKDHDAPITLYGGGRLSTASGEFPPVLDTLTIEFDRHGSVETRGLPVCMPGQLQSTTVAAARKTCGGSIVGKGQGKAVVVFPEQRPIFISSPITIFNGPRKHGNPTVLAHAYTTVPVSTTFVVPVEIEKIDRGLYGYRTEARIPKIAGGAGIPLAGNLRIGRRWTHKGKRYSFVNARCANGRLQARGEFTFKDGTFLTGSFLKRCRVRD